MHILINYTEKDIQLYNKRFKAIIENIRDFVLLHYLTGKKDSKFWKQYKPNLPLSLKENLKTWHKRLPMKEDFDGEYNLFKPENFSVVLKELNLFDKKSIKKEFNSLSQPYKDYVYEQVDRQKSWNDNVKTISHKEYIQKVCSGGLTK